MTQQKKKLFVAILKNAKNIQLVLKDHSYEDWEITCLDLSQKIHWK